MNIWEWSEYVARWREEKEFYTPSSLANITDRDMMLGKLMLVVSEVAEAAEAVRHNDTPNFYEELADTFIRLFDICGSMGINMEPYIEEKMEKNKERPVKHGKFCSL